MVKPISPLIDLCVLALLPVDVAMRQHSQIFTVAGLISWVACCLFFGDPAAALAAESLSGGDAPHLPVGGFDRAALQKELSQPLEALEKEPMEVVRAHVQRLGDLHFALELAVDISPEERRALSEQILTRVSQVGRLIRQRMAEPRTSANSRALPAPAPGLPPRGDLAGVLMGNSGLLLRLLAGLLIAFALGFLAGERRAARARGAVVRSDGSEESPLPVSVPSETPSEGRPMRLEGIRKSVGSGVRGPALDAIRGHVQSPPPLPDCGARDAGNPAHD